MEDSIQIKTFWTEGNVLYFDIFKNDIRLVSKRYTDFDELKIRLRLSARKEISSDIEFPQKLLYHTTSRLNERRRGLEIFLNSYISHSILRDDEGCQEEIKSFLNINGSLSKFFIIENQNKAKSSKEAAKANTGPRIFILDEKKIKEETEEYCRLYLEKEKNRLAEIREQFKSKIKKKPTGC